MIFYRVLEKAHGKKFPYGGGILKAKELFTEREAKREKFTSVFLNSHFEKVELPKQATTFENGARFEFKIS